MPPDIQSVPVIVIVLITDFAACVFQQLIFLAISAFLLVQVRLEPFVQPEANSLEMHLLLMLLLVSGLQTVAASPHSSSTSFRSE